jgi:hypothetical protein
MASDELNGRGVSAADKNRRIRQEALREQLSAKGLVQQVVEISEKLNDLNVKLDANSVSRLKASADLKLKLVNKYLPDLKSTEITGDPDQPLNVKMGWILEGVKPSDKSPST